jgi:hypothetical protein
MTSPRRVPPVPAKKSASPADRSAEFTETQRRLKAEAAERRLRNAPKDTSARPPRRSATTKTRGRG